jgi:hypothetical protein
LYDCWSFQKVAEEAAIPDHRLPQVLGARVASFMAERNGMCRPVVRNYLGMVNGDVSGPLLKVTDRISASMHDFANERISLTYGGPWLVNEPGLHRLPVPAVTLPLLGCERAETELFDAPFACLQLGLGAAGIAGFGDGPFILGAKPLPQVLSSISLVQQQTC